MNSCTYSGLVWLLGSGIQDESGGVSREYDAETRRYGPLSAESTAWFILALLESARPVEDVQRERALQAGQFLLEKAFDLSVDLFVELPTARNGHNGAGARNGQPTEAGFLGSGVIIRALAALHRVTNDQAFLSCAQSCARALQTRMSRVDGSYFTHFDITRQEPFEAGPVGVEQLRVGAALRDLAEAGGGYEFEAPAEMMTRWALGLHETMAPDAYGSTDPLKAAVRYARFLEGLLPSAARGGLDGQVLQSGITRIERVLEENPDAAGRVVPLAQVLRLRLYADVFGVAELDYGQAEREAAELAELQCQTTDPRLDGAFAFRRASGETIVTAEAVAVAVQALSMWEQAADGAFRRAWYELV